MITVFALIASAAVITEMFYFDKIVRQEYTIYRQNWEADGMPSGYFWKPDEHRHKSTMASVIPRCRCELFWLFVTPVWAKADTNLNHYFMLWRVCYVFACLAVLIIIATDYFSKGSFMLLWRVCYVIVCLAALSFLANIYFSNRSAHK